MTDSPDRARHIVAQLMPEVYEDLRRLATAYMRGERADHTLEPTALVHEVFLKLAKQSRLDVNGRTHFTAIAAGAMRQVLVESARAHRTLKRGGQWQRITFVETISGSPDGSEDLLALDDALNALARHKPVLARIVEMRFFGGLTEPEIAAELGRSERWVRGQWAFARQWLREHLTSE